MQIKKTDTLDEETVTVPNLVGLTDVEAAAELKESGLLMEIEGSGKIISQSPARNTVVKKYSIVKVKGDIAVDTTTFYGIE